MAYTATALLLDPETRKPVVSRPAAYVYRLDSGALHPTAATVSAAGVATWTDLVDGVSYMATVYLRNEWVLFPLSLMGGIPLSRLAPGTVPAGVLVPAANVTPGTFPAGTWVFSNVARFYGTASAPSGLMGAFGILSWTDNLTQVVHTIDATGSIAASIQHKHLGADNLYYPLALNPLGGGVGIGTVNPLNAMLQVNGAIRVTGTFPGDLASSGGMDHNIGSTRFFSWGTSGATKGTFQWYVKGADGSGFAAMALDPAFSRLILDSGASGVSMYQHFLVNGVTIGYIGAVGTASHLINNSVYADVAFRAQGGRFLWSADSGNSIAARLYLNGGFTILSIDPPTTQGSVVVTASSNGNAGYVGFYNAVGTRAGYIGYYTDANLHITADTGKVIVHGNLNALASVDIGGMAGSTDSARWYGGKYVINPTFSVNPPNIYYGMLLIQENVSYGGWALYGLLGNAAFTALVGSNGAGGLVFNNTPGVANRINVFFNVGLLTIQNTMAQPVTVYVMMFGPGA